MIFSPLTSDYYSEFLNLYDLSFPPDERRMYAATSDLDAFINENSDRFSILCALNEEGDFLGFISYWNFRNFSYIEHFAVNPEFRNCKIGSTLLDELIKTLAKDGKERILLEVEPLEDDLCRRRAGFYIRHGFSLRDDFEYYQPPYSPGQSGMPLKLMTRGDIPLASPDELEEMLEAVYKSGNQCL